MLRVGRIHASRMAGAIKTPRGLGPPGDVYCFAAPPRTSLAMPAAAKTGVHRRVMALCREPQAPECPGAGGSPPWPEERVARADQ